MKFIHVLVSLLIIAVASFWIYQSIEETRRDAVLNASSHLKLTRDIRIAQLQSDVKTMYAEVRFWAESKSVSDDMQKIFMAWKELGFSPRKRARQLYVTDNPLYPNYAADYYNANDGSSYSEIHEKMHKLLKGLIKHRGYYDVFLIAKNGDIVYSGYKSDDYATNLFTGKFKETNLAQGFREVLDNTNLNHVSLFDYSLYEPSNNQSASFIQTSIVNSDNKTIGVLAFQLPVDPISKVLNNRSGLGKGDSTEILAVGSDFKMRNSTEKLQDKVRSVAIGKALAGEEGVEELVDYRGKKTIIAYAPFHFSQNILGSTAKNTWAIIVKQDLSEVLKPANEEIRMKLTWLAGLTFISLLLAWLITSRKVDLRITDDE